MSFAMGIGIYVVVFAVLAILGFLLLKSVIKAIAIASGIIIVLTLIFGFLVYVDVKDMSQKLQTENKLVLLTDGNNVLTAVKIGDMSNAKGDFTAMIKDGTIVFSQKSEFASLSSSLASKNYDAILGNNYKLILVDIKTFDSVQNVRLFDKINMPAEEARSILRSNTPLDDFMNNDNNLVGLMGTNTNLDLMKQQKAALKQQFITQIGTEESIKAILAVSMFQTVAKDNPDILIMEYQKGDIKVYKETMTFKLLKYVPVSMMKGFASKMSQSESNSSSAPN